MRKNKYNELATTIMLIIGLICIVFGIVVQFLLKDTNDVLSYTISFLGKYMIFAGIVCSLLSIIIKIARISRNNTIANLKSSGQLVYATNLKVWKNYYWGVDRKHWCYLFGEWEDPVTHKKHEFRSDKLWIDIEPIIAEKKVDKIPVYIDNKNPRVYFVDVDELTPTNASTSEQPRRNNVAKIVLITLAIILLSICGIFAMLKLLPTKPTIDNQIPNNNDVEIPSDDSEENECSPFICYDGISDVENKDLIPKANLIDGHLRKLLALISLDDWESGEYTLQDVDKFALHSLIANRFFEEDDYLILENGIDNAILSSEDYEETFKQITGITDVKSYFSDYELKDIKDYSSPETLQDMNNSKQYVFTETDGKTYYIVPFGMGLGVYGVAVISDVIEQDDKTLISIKTCEVDYENNTYTHTKTTTFEIQTNGLRVYNFKVEK